MIYDPFYDTAIMFSSLGVVNLHADGADADVNDRNRGGGGNYTHKILLLAY